MAATDFVMTIDSDEDVPMEDEHEAPQFIGSTSATTRSSSKKVRSTPTVHEGPDNNKNSQDRPNNRRKRVKQHAGKENDNIDNTKKVNGEGIEMNEGFMFDGLAGRTSTLDWQDSGRTINANGQLSIDDIIAQQRAKPATKKTKKEKITKHSENDLDDLIDNEEIDDLDNLIDNEDIANDENDSDVDVKGTESDDAESSSSRSDHPSNSPSDSDRNDEDDKESVESHGMGDVDIGSENEDGDILSNDNDEDDNDEDDNDEDDNDEDDNDEDDNDEDDNDEDDNDENFTSHADRAAQDAEYFSTPLESKSTDNLTFSSLPNSVLSRPILLGLQSLGLHTPTPVQAQTIPVVLMGKDIVGSSVTGSGKTVAFWVGVLERLLLRDKRDPRTRVVVVCPTRELAVQVCDVGKAIAKYTNIEFCLCVGGLSLKVQEAALKKRPDIVVSTPGRLIDHVRNTNSFTLESLEILIIDEADRILEEGFRDELTEIIKSCPASRSTLLFSATITEDVDQLTRLSLNKPVRVKVHEAGITAPGLTQEFVKVRDGKSTQLITGSTDLEDKHMQNARLTRESVLISLCRSAYKTKTIIFFRSKMQAHRMKIVFGLCSLNAAELHGDLSQEQRLESLRLFKDGSVDFLLATDLASRGLDIKGIEQVVNFEMPNSFDIYLHRVGRTARAGRPGRSLTLVGEADRKIAKQVTKRSLSENVKQRVVKAKTIIKTRKEIEGLQDDYDAIVEQEKEEKLLRKTEVELTKGQNMIDHKREIESRPARTWFQSKKEKTVAKDAGRREHNSKFEDGGTSNRQNKEKKLNHKEKRRKEAMDDISKGSGGVASAIRKAKKAGRMKKMGVTRDTDATRETQMKSSGASNNKKKRKGAFSQNKRKAKR